MFLKHSQKGITLFLVIIILAVVLAVAIGLSTILVSQIKMIAGMGNSVKALYAADTGIERVLKIIIAGKEAGLTSSYSSSSDEFDNEASYQVEVVCCSSSDSDCDWSGTPDCPFGGAGDDKCEATKYCIRSIGTFEDVQRAIEVSYEPVD